MPIVSPQVAASADDAHQNIFLAPDLTAANIQLAASTIPLFRSTGGLRFAMDVPKDATIISAIITGNVPDDAFDSPTLDIKAEQADDPDTFSAGDDVLTRWPAGGPSVEWVAADLGSGLVALPDIATVLQPIVERAGWVAGQHVVILLQGRDDVNTTARLTSYDGTPANAATLAVTYVTSVPIDLVGSHTPNVDLVGSHAPTVDLVGSHVATVDLVGSHVATIDLVGSYTEGIELEGSWDE